MTARPDLLAGENLRPAPRQQRSLDKRARLHAAGLAVFGKRGYHQASMEDIARRAGLAVGGVYRHYESKRQLLLALMDEFLATLDALNLELPPTPDVRAGLRALLASAFATDLQYLGAYRAWEEAVLTDNDLARKNAEIRAWTIGRVERLLARLQGMPGARRSVNRTVLASVLDTFFWSLLSQAVRMRRTDLEAWLDAATHLIYHAMFTDAHAKRGLRR